MSKAETFDDKDEAINARDDYNHNQNRRAVMFKLPGVALTNYGGGEYNDIFNDALTSSIWVVVVED